MKSDADLAWRSDTESAVSHLSRIWMFPLQCLMLQRFYTDALFLQKHQLSHCEDSCCIVRVRTWKPMEYRRMLRRLETERLDLCGEFRRRKVRWGWSGLTRTWRTMSPEGFLKASQIELCQICSINLTIFEKIVDFPFAVIDSKIWPWCPDYSVSCVRKTSDKWIRCVLRFFCSSLQTTPSAVQIGIGGLSHLPNSCVKTKVWVDAECGLCPVFLKSVVRFGKQTCKHSAVKVKTFHLMWKGSKWGCARAVLLAGTHRNEEIQTAWLDLCFLQYRKL